MNRQWDILYVSLATSSSRLSNRLSSRSCSFLHSHKLVGVDHKPIDKRCGQVGLGCIHANDNAKYICSHFSCFVSPAKGSSNKKFSVIKLVSVMSNSL